MSELLSSNCLSKTPNIRLYVKQNISVSDQKNINHQLQIANNDFEYLVKVMRRKINDKIIVFDGYNGDFIAIISDIKKNFLVIEIIEKISEFKAVPNITLAFAPVKNVRIDFIASKASELGVKTFQPILTHHTIVDKINYERFSSNIKEACEQCGRNDIAKILPIIKLDKFLNENTDDKILIFGDESGKGLQAKDLLSKIKIQLDQEIIVFIGPEGGFSESEFNKFRLKNCFALNMGPRILRSDTAIISALTLIQEFIGDFNFKANS